jgi:hypothetical protein
VLVCLFAAASQKPPTLVTMGDNEYEEMPNADEVAKMVLLAAAGGTYRTQKDGDASAVSATGNGSSVRRLTHRYAVVRGCRHLTAIKWTNFTRITC